MSYFIAFLEFAKEKHVDLPVQKSMRDKSPPRISTLRMDEACEIAQNIASFLHSGVNEPWMTFMDKLDIALQKLLSAKHKPSPPAGEKSPLL
jgi:hypothetical protein